jgi:hypothetical protein
MRTCGDGKYVGLTDEKIFKVELKTDLKDGKLLMSFSKTCIPEKWQTYGDLPVIHFPTTILSFNMRCQCVITLQNS